MGLPTDDQHIGVLIILISTSISLICCLSIIRIIYTIGKWNGYYSIVFTLALFQAIYNLSFYLLPGYGYFTVISIYQFFSVFSQLGVCFWTNAISLLLLYTISYLQQSNTKLIQRYSLFIIVPFSAAISLAFVLLSVFRRHDKSLDYLYFWIRAVSLLANITVFIIVSYIFDQTRCIGVIDFCCKHDFALRDKTHDLITVLTNRLKYYPIVQIVSRCACLWWEYKYGVSLTSFDEGNYGLEKEISFYLYCLFAPIDGIGYFSAFLLVHPEANRIFYRNIVTPIYRCCCCIPSFRLPKDSDMTMNNVKRATRDSTDSTYVVRNSILVSVPKKPTTKKTVFMHGDASSSYEPNDEFRDSQQSLPPDVPYNFADNDRLTLSGVAYELDEDYIWSEFYRRKFSRASMTVHA
jgi:hypothetical protein